MLKRLAIKDFIIIKKLEIDFTEGLNVLSGETGAGKSIILGALLQLLGAKSSKDLIRPSGNSSLLQAIFELEHSDLKNIYELDENGSGELIISKEIISSGKSVSKINGVFVSQKELRELASALVSVYGQDDKLKIYDKSEQLKILDAYMREEGATERAELKKLSSDYKNKLKELNALTDMDERAVLREITLLEFQADEIDKAELKSDDELIEERCKLMKNSEHLISGLSEVCNLLDNTDESGASNRLQQAIKALDKLRKYDESLSGSIVKLNDLSYAISDIFRDLERNAGSYNFDESDFEQLERRLDTLNNLRKKYGTTLSDVELYRESLDEKINALKSLSVRKTELSSELDKIERQYDICSEKLSSLRKKYASELALATSLSLRDLNFNNADCKVKFEEKKAMSENGKDEVEFMVRLNSGLPYAPLKKVASGGEASRIMLALQEQLAGVYSSPLMIFDEIDAGLSGNAAIALAEKIYKVAGEHQIILISHNLQLALYADNQYLIRKYDDGNETSSEIKLLTEDERAKEICRLIGASLETEGMLKEAAQMLTSVNKIKERIRDL